MATAEEKEVVDWYSKRMVDQLRKNKEKGSMSWIYGDLNELFLHLEDEVDEVSWALHDFESDKQALEELIDECADVGCMAMMVADLARKIYGRS